MQPHPLKLLRLASLVVTLALLPELAGCGGKRSLSQADLDRAQKAVEAALTVWQKGEPPSRLATLDPPIQMVDPDWKAGVKLLRHEIKKTEGYQGQNPVCVVVLSVVNRKGQKQNTEVPYEVDLGPKLVISRAFH
jgi:hypothetical protein